MDLEFSADQVALRGAVREYLTKRYPTELIRELQRGGDGCPADLWRELAAQGWLGMAFPERYGGGDASLFDLGIFYEESGRVLLPSVFYSTVHAGLLIRELGTESQQSALLPRVVDGSVVGTVAFAEPSAFQDHRHFTTTATARGGGQWSVTGSKAFVAGAASADLLIVVARAESGGLVVLPVPRHADGVVVTELQTIGKDGQCRVDLDDVRVDEALGETADATAAVVRVTDVVTALQVMEMVGGAGRVLDLTVEYVMERRQFGRPIGSFQAVQHHAANMAIDVRGARLAALQAMWLVSEGLPATRELAIAKSAANQAYVRVTLTAHQLHGGMGIVLEHDLHLWSQRARSTSLQLGTTDAHLDRLATTLGL